MPRANRYILPGRVCHLTHRCHNGSFLLRFAKDRTEYRERLRRIAKQMKVSLLGYCITSNHVHLLVKTEQPELVSKLMQKLEGEFAEYYNARKHRSGAFWQGRYWCTMVDSAQYLWDCMKYIDLNMVRAGVVSHPSEWKWCGFSEAVGERKRYRVLDYEAILQAYGNADLAQLQRNYRHEITAAVRSRASVRDPIWTESVAVGSESFVREIEKNTYNRVELTVEPVDTGSWLVKESGVAYG